MSTNLMKFYVSPLYLGEPDLDGVPQKMQITGFGIDRGVKSSPTSDAKDCVTLTLAGQKKKLILNKTNAKSIAKAYGKHGEEWLGKWIELRPEKTNVGREKDVPCIRVYPCEAPRQPAQQKAAPAPITETTRTAILAHTEADWSRAIIESAITSAGKPLNEWSESWGASLLKKIHDEQSRQTPEPQP